MIEPLLALPAHVREQLAHALRAGLLVAPYEPTAVGALLGDSASADTAAEVLAELARRGITGAAVALALEAAALAAAQVQRPELVWSGPEVEGLHARDTARVYEELVRGARRSLWISTFTYYDGPKAFKSLAQRMDALPNLRVRLLINIGRRWGDPTPPPQLITAFAQRLWQHDWPGTRRPAVFYDPRSVELDQPGAVLHAKAIVADDEIALVTSANLTEAAFERNIEAGVLSRDRTLASALAVHFQALIDRGLLLPLP